MTNTRNVVTLSICSVIVTKQHATTDFGQLQCDPAVIDPEQDIAWIPHSSGSTGIPKLFKTSHAQAMRELRLIRAPFFPSKSNWVASALYVSSFCLMACEQSASSSFIGMTLWRLGLVQIV